MPRFAELEAFITVVDRRSFTAAASDLGIAKSYVSRLVSQLEDRLGVRLLHRTTRSLSLTDTGAALYERARSVLSELDEAERSAADARGVPQGLLRVSLPVSFGVRHVAPALADFATLHPQLTLDLSFSDRFVDIVGDGFDLVVRIARLHDSAMIARKLTTTRTLTVASPEWVEHHGQPATPEDLRDRPCLLYAHQASNSSWTFTGVETVSVKVSGRFIADNGEAMVAAGLRGLGVLRAPDFFVVDHLRSGALVRLLPDWETELGVWAIYPHSRHLSAKVRAAVDHLAGVMAAAPWAASGYAK